MFTSKFNASDVSTYFRYVSEEAQHVLFFCQTRSNLCIPLHKSSIHAYILVYNWSYNGFWLVFGLLSPQFASNMVQNHVHVLILNTPVSPKEGLNSKHTFWGYYTFSGPGSNKVPKAQCRMRNTLALSEIFFFMILSCCQKNLVYSALWKLCVHDWISLQL